MSTIITRSGKGSALTHTELDTNFKKASQAKTTTYNVAESDNRDTIECSGTFTINLPDVTTVLAASDTDDFQVCIKNTGSGIITIGRTTGADTIDGVAADLTLYPGAFNTFKTNQAGDGYNIIGGLIVAGNALLETVTISSPVDFVEFTSNIDDTYDKYKITFDDVHSSGAISAYLAMTLRDTGVYASANYAAEGSVITTFAEIPMASNTSASGYASSGEIIIKRVTRPYGKFDEYNSAGASSNRGYWYLDQAVSDLDGIKLTVNNSGVIDLSAGTFRLWGLPV